MNIIKFFGIGLLISLYIGPLNSNANPVFKPDIDKKPNKQINAKYLSLNFKDIPVRDLLMLLATVKQLNMVLSDTITGSVTLQLSTVTWQQALDTLLEMRGLSARQKGNILFIAPIAEINTHEIQQQASAPLKTAIINLQYVKAADLGALLKNQNNGLLTTQGKIIIDERTNKIWIKDTEPVLEYIREFLKNMDVPTEQVQISARIVNVEESSIESLGIKFGTIMSQAAVNTGSDQLHMDIPESTIDSGHFNLAIAKMSQGALLAMEITALEKEGHAHTISNPQLMTANRQTAQIESGQEIPYQENTASGATNTAFKKAVLALKVTPEITSDNKILLNLVVNQDKVDSLTVNGVPAISTQQVQSQVLLQDGETIILGGIYEQSNDSVVARIPFLSAIPLIGQLFKNKEIQNNRKELLILITPKIAKPLY